MKKFLMILFVLCSLTAKCQFGWTEFYSEKDLRVLLQQAKNPKERIDALGLLGKKGLSTDSTMKEIYAITNSTNDKKLKALALWWDAAINSSDTTKMKKLLQFSEQTQLVSSQVAADLLLADYYFFDRPGRSLYCAKAADSLLEKLPGTKEIDSLRIQVFRRIAHAYIRKGDAINTARYLLPLRNYAERDNDDRIKMQAVEVLADMYFEGDKKRSLSWNIMLHEYFKKTNQLQKYSGQTYNLAVLYSQLYVSDSIPEYKMQAIHYFKELDKLIDSLHVYGWFLFYMLQSKFDIGLVSGGNVIKLIDNDYNHNYHFSAWQSRELKLKIYLATNQFDSLQVYIAKIPNNTDYRDIWMKDYYLKKGDFGKAIPILKQFQEYAEPHHDIGILQWIYDDLVKAYVGIKDYRLAYEYKLKSLQMKDTMDKRNSKEQILSMETQKQIELQQAAFDDEQGKTAFRNRMRIYGFTVGLAALLVVALILWKNNRRKQKDKLKIEQAYNELKSTQQQLIQSEKMASLGELTAGIAHEIQNPLNFVNNFSEVNNELIEEVKSQKAKLKSEEFDELLDSIFQNNEKISHHGKRADAIVKGMLQHSRASTGQKEPTDINALADEYLRLAYHGLRAKDKSFNAKFNTDFDSSIGKINIVPQDIGRVLLNLINNAFYAVDEKKSQLDGTYDPTVTVSTKQSGSRVEIKVADNGNGISQKVLDKIFQPFFTTKPTGQGTGLGLSLSYDIIKAHGGEIKVETKEGKGTEFIIYLRIQ